MANGPLQNMGAAQPIGNLVNKGYNAVADIGRAINKIPLPQSTAQKQRADMSKQFAKDFRAQQQKDVAASFAPKKSAAKSAPKSSAKKATPKKKAK